MAACGLPRWGLGLVRGEGDATGRGLVRGGAEARQGP